MKSAATCQSKAVYYYSCECGEKGSETFEYGDLADHTGETATCNKRAVCEVCGKEYGEVAEHSYVQKVTTERYLKSVATCQSEAVYYYSCVCGMTGTATFEYGELADHDYGELIYGYSADCENDGVKNHYRCSVCEKDFDENKQELSSLVIPAAHEFEGWEDEIAATCSKTGVRGHNHCNVCGKDFGAGGNEIGNLIIKANGHNIENGKCTVCGMPEPTSGIKYVSYTDDPETYMVVGYDSTTEAKNVTSIVISDVINGYTVTKIRHDAFRYCSALTSVTIPASITCIDSNAFYGCGELASINYLGDLAEWNRIEGLEYLMTRGKADKTVTIGGKEVAGDLVIPEGVGSVADYAFYKCGKLTSMVIPDSVKTIGKGAFYGCSELTSVNILKGVTSIGEINFDGAYDGMFYGCGKLTSIIIPDGVTCIGNDSFRECSRLTSVSIPDSVTRIGVRAFAGCGSLTEIKIPDGVTDIYRYEKSNVILLQRNGADERR